MKTPKEKNVERKNVEGKNIEIKKRRRKNNIELMKNIKYVFYFIEKKGTIRSLIRTDGCKK